MRSRANSDLRVERGSQRIAAPLCWATHFFPFFPFVQHTTAMSDKPPSYDVSRANKLKFDFPILKELHGKRVVLGMLPPFVWC
jgi:hypothetical protein